MTHSGYPNTAIAPTQSVLSEEMNKKRYIYQKNKKGILIWTAILFLSLLVERFTFVVSVYKTKGHGYVLILAIIFVTVIFNFIN